MKGLKRLWLRVWGRVTKVGRRASSRTRAPRRAVAGAVRRMPLPAKLRQRLYQFVPWRPWTVQVSADRLLLGAQNSLSAAEFATRSDNLLWASTRVSDGPHAALLRQAAASPDLSDDEILEGPYGQFAHMVIRLTGNFFSARDDAGIVAVARDYIARSGDAESGGGTGDTTGRSLPRTEIRATPIKNSDCYQVIDGHHRVAAAVFRGETSIVVRPSWLQLTTPLQDTLDDMTWIGGQRELYQPLDYPELEQSWVTVRKCTDRLDKMVGFLDGLDSLPRPASYLDVASCYSWFVAQMSERGYDAYGLERDPLARPLGRAAFGVDPSQVMIGDAVELLSRSDRQWDVVSCLSLLHHFALGRGSVSAEEFARLLDKVTAHVLILDTGETHEEWLRNRLPGWDTDDVRAFLEHETSFDEVIDLGPDEDAVPPYEENYGRHLFACVRR